MENVNSTYPQMSRNQHAYLSYVREHPGCCIADVDRACRVNPNAGHRWVYDGVARLIRQGVLSSQRIGRRVTLFEPSLSIVESLIPKKNLQEFREAVKRVTPEDLEAYEHSRAAS